AVALELVDAERRVAVVLVEGPQRAEESPALPGREGWADQVGQERPGEVERLISVGHLLVVDVHPAPQLALAEPPDAAGGDVGDRTSRRGPGSPRRKMRRAGE